MYKSHMMRMIVLFAVPSMALCMPLTNISPTIEDSHSQEYPIEKNIITDSKTVENRQMCMKAFGHSQFCECLFNGQTVGWNFPIYVQVVTKPRDGNDYDGFTKEQIHMFEQIIEFRNNCISEQGFN